MQFNTQDTGPMGTRGHVLHRTQPGIQITLFIYSVGQTYTHQGQGSLDIVTHQKLHPDLILVSESKTTGGVNATSRTFIAQWSMALAMLTGLKVITVHSEIWLGVTKLASKFIYRLSL